MQAFRQARKIEDIPFPWPYAQVCSFLFITFAAIFPLIGSAHSGARRAGFDTFWLPPLITFFATAANAGMFRTGKVLEDPFVHPPNELPSLSMQKAFNARLLAVFSFVH